MQYLKTYLDKIKGRGNENLAESIRQTANDIGDRHLKNFSFLSHETGLLFGNVQSGKTAQMFGIICKAADLGFPAFVILTTDNVTLQNQTQERVIRDLEGFCVCGENDGGLFIKNSLIRPAIIILKKNYRVLKLWANIFSNTGFMKGNPLFIVDDEGDAASLNTKVNQNQQSSINRYLDIIKNGASSSLYLQVTGTPQALLLQTAASGWRPLFTYYFEPGKDYLGGDFFFPEDHKPDCVKFIEKADDEIKTAVIRHLAVASQLLSSGSKTANCLFHPGVRQASHESYARKISAALDWCRGSMSGEFQAALKEEYDSLHPAHHAKQPWDVIYETACELLNKNAIKTLIMNGQYDVPNEAYQTGCNFIVGGNTLGRGVTFPALQTICYTRTSKKPQADTMWQHSRMFGYDRDPGLMMVYMSEELFKLFADINAANNSIIAQAEQNFADIRLFYPPELAPTRKNVLDNRHVSFVTGGTNYYPFSPENNTYEELSDLLKVFSEKEPFYQVSLRLIKELLKHIIPSPDFKLRAFLSVIDVVLAETPASQAILIVRRGREITKGTGALLSPNDWKLGAGFMNKIVLTMYEVTGTKGWGGKPLWVPNIKLPHGYVYYDVAENDDD